MYTMLQIVAILMIISSVGGFLTWFIYNVITYLDSGHNLHYPSLYNREEEKKRRENSKKELRKISRWIFFISFFLFATVLAMFASKNLDRLECSKNDGQFEEWDNGFNWQCYNPDLINQTNNFRVITEQAD